MWIFKNENSNNNRVGDCVVRAISTATNQSWEHTFVDLCLFGLIMYDMPSSNAVWGAYLSEKGYKRRTVPNYCNLYTVDDFCKDHPKGTYILGTGTHAVAVIDGDFFDNWNSSQELPIYYFEKMED